MPEIDNVANTVAEFAEIIEKVAKQRCFYEGKLWSFGEQCGHVSPCPQCRSRKLLKEIHGK